MRSSSRGPMPRGAGRARRAMKQSAGTLLYRHRQGQAEVLIVHPSGNYNRASRGAFPRGFPTRANRSKTPPAARRWKKPASRPARSCHWDRSSTRKAANRCTPLPAPRIAGEPRSAFVGGRSRRVRLTRRARELLHPEQRVFIRPPANRCSNRAHCRRCRSRVRVSLSGAVRRELAKLDVAQGRPWCCSWRCPRGAKVRPPAGSRSGGPWSRRRPSACRRARLRFFPCVTRTRILCQRPFSNSW